MALNRRSRVFAWGVLGVFLLALPAAFAQNPQEALRSLFDSLAEEIESHPAVQSGSQSPEEVANSPGRLQPGLVNCAILTYGNGIVAPPWTCRGNRWLEDRLYSATVARYLAWTCFCVARKSEPDSRIRDDAPKRRSTLPKRRCLFKEQTA